MDARRVVPEALHAEADYCRGVVSVAASESTLLRWRPRLFSRAGVMRGFPLELDGMAVT